MLKYCAVTATSTGRLCRWRVWPGRPCPHHGTNEGITRDELLALERAKARPLRPARRHGALRPPSVEPPEPAEKAAETPESIIKRDLSEILWQLIEQCWTGELDAKYGAVLVSAIRLVSSLPESALGSEEAWNEAYLRGNIVNGIPPETEDEWDLATRVFDDDALAYLRTWNGMLPGELLERDRDDMHEPLRLVERAGVELEPPVLIEDED